MSLASNKTSKHLQDQVKKLIKRKLSPTDDDDIPVSSLKKQMETQKNGSPTDSNTEANELKQKLAEMTKKYEESQKEKENLINNPYDANLFENYVENSRDIPQVNAAESILENQVNNNIEESQLYGRNYGEMMICIGNEIYCKKSIYNMAIGASHKSTHVARKLMEGIFKMEVLMRATITGQTGRNPGKNPLTNTIPLDAHAKNSIIDFAIRESKKRGWEPQSHRDIARSMGQRLIEIRNKKTT